MGPRHSESDRKPVIVGVDGSDGAARALAWAAAKTETLGPVTPLLSYRVESLGDGLGTPALYAEIATLMESEADSRLSAALDDHPELTGRARRMRGVAGRCLVEAAASASLLVVGSRGRSALAETLLGSVGSYCTKHAEVPVAVVPPGARVAPTFDEIVVGVDGSPNSVAALRWALDHAPEWGRVRAVACWTPAPGADRTRSMSAIERAAGRDLEHTLAAVGPPTVEGGNGEGRNGEGPTIEARTAFGDARQVLRELARDADLLVVGARGHRGVPYLLLGSVTTSLLHHPTSPTVVVPLPPDDPAGGDGPADGEEAADRATPADPAG